MLDHSFTLFSNGSITFEDHNKSHLYEKTDFCVAFDQISEDGRRLQREYVRLCPQDEGHGHIFLGTSYVYVRTFILVKLGSHLLMTFMLYTDRRGNRKNQDAIKIVSSSNI